MTNTISVTIDGAGRIVVPKNVRDLMGLRAGSTLEMRFEAGLLTFCVPSVMSERVDEQGRVFYVAREGAPTLNDQELREVLDSVRR